MDEKELEQRIDDRTNLIEATKAIECLMKQMHIARVGIKRLYEYDQDFAKKIVYSINKIFDDYIETSIYKEDMENAMLEDFFGINKT
jgi:hypothetical protein